MEANIFSIVIILLSSSSLVAVANESDNCPFRRNNYDPVEINRVLTKGQAIAGASTNITGFPCWFDLDLARTGQKFAQAHFGPSFIAYTVATVLLFSHPQIQNVLLPFRVNDTLRRRTKGDLATAQQIFLWYHADILSPEWSYSVQQVRKIHVRVFREVQNQTETNVYNSENPRDHWRSFERNEALWKAFKADLSTLDTPEFWRERVPFDFSASIKFNQYIVSLTHWFFPSLILLRPESFGVSKYTQRDLRGFAHLWALIAYRVGLDEEFVFCKGNEDQWDECKMYWKYVLKNHYLPHLLRLSFEGELLMQGQFEVVKEFIPGIPLEFWLITILEKHLDAKATNLRNLQKWPAAAVTSTVGWFTSDAPLDYKSVLWLENKAVSGILQFLSLRTFGNSGRNLTHVSESHFSLTGY